MHQEILLIWRWIRWPRSGISGTGEPNNINYYGGLRQWTLHIGHAKAPNNNDSTHIFWDKPFVFFSNFNADQITINIMKATTRPKHSAKCMSCYELLHRSTFPASLVEA